MDQQVYFDEDEDQEPETAVCPACGRPNTPLGPLGNLVWYDCRGCGMQYSQEQ